MSASWRLSHLSRACPDPESFAASNDTEFTECSRQSISGIEKRDASLETDCQQPFRLQPKTKGDHDDYRQFLLRRRSGHLFRRNHHAHAPAQQRQLFRPTNKGGDREPDYRIFQEHDGATVEFGAAWKRSSERGRDFLSVMLDDPALPSSLNAALFLSDRDERATLVWQRQTRKAPAAEPERAKARPRKSAAAPSCFCAFG